MRITLSILALMIFLAYMPAWLFVVAAISMVAAGILYACITPVVHLIVRFW